MDHSPTRWLTGRLSNAHYVDPAQCTGLRVWGVHTAVAVSFRPWQRAFRRTVRWCCTRCSYVSETSMQFPKGILRVTPRSPEELAAWMTSRWIPAAGGTPPPLQDPEKLTEWLEAP